VHNCDSLLSLSHDWWEWLLNLWRLVDCKGGQARRQQACLEDLGKQINQEVCVRYTSICKLDYKTLDEYILDVINQSWRKKEREERRRINYEFLLYLSSPNSDYSTLGEKHLSHWGICFLNEVVLSWCGCKYSVWKWFVGEMCVLSQHTSFTVEVCRVVTSVQRVASWYFGRCTLGRAEARHPAIGETWPRGDAPLIRGCSDPYQVYSWSRMRAEGRYVVPGSHIPERLTIIEEA
jgi:hypothetical protein